jgi:hypothetical protein
MAFTQKELTRVLTNPMTKQLIEWVDAQKTITKVILSPQFFHKTHTARDRDVLCEIIQNYYTGSKVERIGTTAVKITF